MVALVLNGSKLSYFDIPSSSRSWDFQPRVPPRLHQWKSLGQQMKGRLVSPSIIIMFSFKKYKLLPSSLLTFNCSVSGLQTELLILILADLDYESMLRSTLTFLRALIISSRKC